MPLEACTHDPWKGSLYDAGLRSKRVLLLGESHYAGPDTKAGIGPQPGTKTFTSDGIRAWALGSRRHRFFTKVPRLFDADPTVTQAREDFWAHVAFYNYVQQIVGDRGRMAPTDEMWASAATPFRDVLEDLRPQRVVVFGSRLWSRLPRGPQRLLGEVAGDPVHAEARSLSNGDEVLFGMTAHPSSSRFRYATWKPRIALLLAID